MKAGGSTLVGDSLDLISSVSFCVVFVAYSDTSFLSSSMLKSNLNMVVEYK